MGGSGSRRGIRGGALDGFQVLRREPGGCHGASAASRPAANSRYRPSTAIRACSGTFHPPAWSAVKGARICRGRRRRHAADAPAAHDQPDVAQRGAATLAVVGRPCRRTATVTASSASQASGPAASVEPARYAGVGGQPRGACGTAWARLARVERRLSSTAASTTPVALQRIPRSPSTVRARHSVATTSLRSAASSPRGRDDASRRRWSPRRRRRRARPRLRAPPPGSTVGEHLDPGEHDVRRRGAHEAGEPYAVQRPCRQPLATDHVLQEHLPDRGSGGQRVQDADPRQHVRRDGDGPAPALELVPGVGSRVGVAGQRRRARRGGRREPGGVVQQDVGVAPVGPARRAARRRVGPPAVPRPPAASSGPACTCTTRPPADSADPVTGLGGDHPLVADDRQPQATARAGADTHVGARAPPDPDRRCARPRRAPRARRPSHVASRPMRACGCGAPRWPATCRRRRRRARPW